MKKLLLFSLAVFIGTMAMAQVPVPKKDVKVAKVNAEQLQTQSEKMGVKPSPYTSNSIVPPMAPPAKGTDVVTVIDIGSAANIYTYGYNNGSSTILWYDQNVNTVVHTHRMGGPVGPPDQYSGDLAYDISMDAGMTWTNQVKMYESNISGGEYNTDAARYPQGALYNPEGNTDPMNTWVAFFAPNLDGTNGGTWGGYSYGVASVADPTDTTKHLLPADLDAGFYQGIPTSYFMATGTDAWMADASLLDSYTEYLGDIIFMHGEFSESINDMEYEEFLAPADCDYARYLKMGFGPNGQVGYVLWNNFDGSVPELDDWSYPLLLKTEDGGETWADELISIETSGPDGIEAVKNYLTDEQIIELYGELVDRDEILYSTPYFNSDIAVDAWGNPHVAITTFIASDDPGFIIIEPETMGVFDLYTTDGMDETWHGVHLGTLKNYEADYGDDYIEYNRLQVASTWDGTKMFFAWNDTRLEGVEDNTSPDIYARGFDLMTNMITEGDDVAGATNVTAFSEAMWQSRFFVMSAHAIDNEGTYTLPMTYAGMDESLDLTLPVQFKYIQDFAYTDADFTLTTGNPGFPVGMVENQVNESILSVSQNQPNPVSTTTKINLTLDKAANVNVVVTSMTGQTVLEQSEGFVPAGNSSINLDASELSNGVYFYTVYAGNSKVTRKMIVE